MANTFVITLGIIFLAGFTQGQDFTQKEKKALTTLKENAGDLMRYRYFKDDYVLVNFLRDHNFDQDKVLAQLKETKNWRKKNNLDAAELDPNLEQLEPYRHIGVDKMGRPLALTLPASWDNRKVILAGNRDKLILQWSQFTERTHRKIQELRAEGKRNITQAHLILDLHNYNLRQHACLQCFPTYFSWVRDWEQNYPRMYYQFTYINTPSIFQPLLQLLKPVFTEYLRARTKVIGADKAAIQKELYQYIEPKELLKRWGGTRVL